MSCCNTVLSIGIVNACGVSVVVLPVNAPATGIYTLKIELLNKIISTSQHFNINSPMVFTFIGLNENFTYTGWIENSSGARLTINSYDCIEFETKCIDIDES